MPSLQAGAAMGAQLSRVSGPGRRRRAAGGRQAGRPALRLPAAGGWGVGCRGAAFGLPAPRLPPKAVSAQRPGRGRGEGRGAAACCARGGAAPPVPTAPGRAASGCLRGAGVVGRCHGGPGAPAVSPAVVPEGERGCLSREPPTCPRSHGAAFGLAWAGACVPARAPAALVRGMVVPVSAAVVCAFFFSRFPE